MGFWGCPHCAAKEDLVAATFPIFNQAVKYWNENFTGTGPPSFPSFAREVPTIACRQCQGSLQEKDYHLTDAEVRSSSKTRLRIAGLLILLNGIAWGVLMELNLSAWLYVPFFLISLGVALLKKYKLRESLRPPEVYPQDPLAHHPGGQSPLPTPAFPLLPPLPICPSDEG